MFKYSMTEGNQRIRFDNTTGPLRKHDIIKACSTEYLTTEIELVLPTFKSWTVYRIAV